MKKTYLLNTLFILLSLTFCNSSFADEEDFNDSRYFDWEQLVWENDKEEPSIVHYTGELEKAPNAREYYHLYTPYPWRGEALPYGYRIQDKKFFIYNYETNEETIALDFNLKEGDTFTTFNGVEWRVESVKDTIVKCMMSMVEKNVTRKLLTVQSIDGRFSDQWLEDFGSFKNRLMIHSLENTKCSHVLYLYNSDDYYMARNINEDPIFSHVSDFLWGHYREFGEEDVRFTTCTYKDGKVTINSYKWYWAHREYSCFYRKGDDIYRIFSKELLPCIDGGTYQDLKDEYSFQGLPNPASGEYAIHMNDEVYYTGIQEAPKADKKPSRIFDLQGKALPACPTKGFYIKDGEKKIK